jgi:hypothetical protein
MVRAVHAGAVPWASLAKKCCDAGVLLRILFGGCLACVCLPRKK